jgi:hypothetical protein
MRALPFALVLVLSTAGSAVFGQHPQQRGTAPAAAGGHAAAGRMPMHTGQVMTPEQHMHMMNQMMMADQMGFEALMMSRAAASRAARTPHSSSAPANRHAGGSQSNVQTGPNQSKQQLLRQNGTNNQSGASSQKHRSTHAQSKRAVPDSPTTQTTTGALASSKKMSAHERAIQARERAALRREAERARHAALRNAAQPVGMNTSITMLRDAHAALATTALPYQGHLSQAMANVTNALAQLGGGTPMTGNGGVGAGTMDRAASDGVLRRARADLVTAQSGLTTQSVQTINHPNAQISISAAILEIDRALASR